MRREAQTAPAGFTLFEVLTALAILAGAFVGIFAVFRVASDVAVNTREQGAARETARVVRVLLARDLDSVFHPAVADRAGRSGFRFLVPSPSGGDSRTSDGDQVVVDMITLARLDFDRDEPTAGLTRVRYLLRPSDDGETRFTLVRAELADPHLLPSTLSDPPWREVTLARNVAAFSLAPLDERRAERDSWDSRTRESQGNEALPRMLVATYRPVREATDTSPTDGDGPAGSFTTRLALPIGGVSPQGVQ
ncbi:prepilin-type N-terminal cleavage/methylation domain-containing protein [Desulfovibrio sulfodismutans]|uniref:Prepilin-type N-terminal cleavage/methylation domain-containing protein n=1 Tax=Desulfolutivibrio sulfodismutans TaxID=63561 RepID=A0A7K3NQP6_9BACT|nr:prepilin-type N-terminal cleavage/methylation domain-containing protein [Desulfolutivibrio sulfodismutans]NDY58536.1 prepilin-type N-terminal cleavage/methylation domain-containing protein [Desulfolutivibrio sulfodismutans]QLA14129.1 prepilin-type N-terminal cleavage/methylation domain-containing protein [Desulfolutivibrio sulfodismutans DSM 3696]